jgi:hypothetical protein
MKISLKKIRNKIAFTVIIFFSIAFIYQITTFPSSDNFICSGLSWLCSVTSIIYFFWKKKDNSTNFKRNPMSSISLLMFTINYFAGALIMGSLNSLPLTFNLVSKTLPFVWPSHIFFLLLLMHISTNKLIFFLKIKNFLRNAFIKVGIDYSPTLKEIFISGLICLVIWAYLYSGYGEEESDIGGYSNYFVNLMMMPAVIVSQKKYHILYSKKKVFMLYCVFLFLFLFSTILKGARGVLGNYLLVTLVSYSITANPSRFFLKKNILKSFFLFFILFAFFNFIDGIFKNIRANRGLSEKGSSLSERLKNNTKESEVSEGGFGELESYVYKDAEMIKRLIMNKLFDNDYVFFNKLTPDVKSLLKKEIISSSFIGSIPGLFFKNKEDKKKQELQTLYGTPLDAFRYYAAGNLRSFLMGSSFFEYYLLMDKLTFYLLLLCYTFVFCFFDSFVFLGKNSQLTFSTLFAPYLYKTALNLTNIGMIKLPREFIVNFIVIFIVSSFILKVFRFLFRL